MQKFWTAATVEAIAHLLMALWLMITCGVIGYGAGSSDAYRDIAATRADLALTMQTTSGTAFDPALPGAVPLP